jgi:spermidine synthase
VQPAAPSIRDGALLAVAGAGLLGSQYIASRELGSTFFVTELSIVAATVVTLIGPSLSYALGDRLRRAGGWLSVWALLALLFHLSLPFSIRAVVGWLGATHPMAAAAATAGGVALLCGYYAVLLPLRATTASLSFLYGAELCGAILTLLLLAAAPSYRFVLLGFLLLPSGVAGLTLGRRAALFSLAIATLVWFASPSLDRAVSTHYFRQFHGLSTPNVVESVYSPYQRIDVVTDSGDTALFLDGVPFYRSGDLDAFNVFLAELPGSLLPKRGSALVVGSGSFSSAARLHRLGYRVLVIELDGQVADLGFRHFASIHKLKAGDVQLQIADARQALSQRKELFDLIVLDVPAPYRIQTALLHAPSFYRQVAAHLAPGGVAAISLCDGLHEPLGKRIAASAAQVFPDLMVVESNTVGLGVLYGATRLPFAVSEVAAALKEKDPQGGEVTPQRLIRNLVLDASPLSERDLLGVLLLSRQAITGQ